MVADNIIVLPALRTRPLGDDPRSVNIVIVDYPEVHLALAQPLLAVILSIAIVTMTKDRSRIFKDRSSTTFLMESATLGSWNMMVSPASS